MKKRFLALLTAAVCTFGSCGILDRETEQEIREELKNATAEVGDVWQEAKTQISQELSEINWAETILEPSENGEKKSLKVLYEGSDEQWMEIEDMEAFQAQIDTGSWEKTDAIPADAEAVAHFSIQQKGTIHLGEEDTDRYYEIAEMTLYEGNMVSLTILGNITQYLHVILPQDTFTANYILSDQAAEYLRAFAE